MIMNSMMHVINVKKIDEYGCKKYMLTSKNVQMFIKCNIISSDITNDQKSYKITIFNKDIENILNTKITNIKNHVDDNDFIESILNIIKNKIIVMRYRCKINTFTSQNEIIVINLMFK